MFVLIARNLWRHPLRNGLTLLGLAVAMGVLVCIVSFGDGYRHALSAELDRAGVQMMLVPLGCPYDAAVRVLKNQTVDNSLPASALEAVRGEAAVAVAAPLLLAAQPRQNERRVDLWVGLDETALKLKPWWQVRAGQAWFSSSNEVILGADVAALEMRMPNDKFYSPELKQEFRVASVLNRSGTSDDSAIFVPLATAQRLFAQPGRLTAIAIRLKDPTLIRGAASRLQAVPGGQVVTMTEMMGTFLNLLGTVRTLVLAVATIAIVASALTVLNTLLAAVLERANEIAMMRAVGASRAQVFVLLLGESLAVTWCGAALGTGLAWALGPRIEALAKGWLPFAPPGTLLSISVVTLLPCFLLILGVGAAAALYPAWRAACLPPALATKPA